MGSRSTRASTFADGFECGGSGPTQLALAILLAVADDQDTAERFYQQLKAGCTAAIESPTSPDMADVRQWLDLQGGAVRPRVPGGAAVTLGCGWNAQGAELPASLCAALRAVQIAVGSALARPHAARVVR